MYDWAGQIRTVEIAKGDLFCLARHIEVAAKDVFARVSQVVRDLESNDGLIPVSMADLYGDTNALHPFRDGNGRAQRAFLFQLAREHGAPYLDWGRLDATAHLDASIASLRGDNRGLHAALRVAAHQPVPNYISHWGDLLADPDRD